jgi:hypothetical protein
MMINKKVKKQIRKQQLLININTIHCLVWIAKTLYLANLEWETSSSSKITEWTDTNKVHLMVIYKAYEQ